MLFPFFDDVHIWLMVTIIKNAFCNTHLCSCRWVRCTVWVFGRTSCRSAPCYTDRRHRRSTRSRPGTRTVCRCPRRKAGYTGRRSHGRSLVNTIQNYSSQWKTDYVFRNI